MHIIYLENQKKGWFRLVDSLKILFKSLAVYSRLDLLWLLRDTKYCILQIVADVVSSSSVIIGILLLSIKFDGLSGMSHSQVILMISISSNVHGIYNLFFANYNNGIISRIIGRGQIEHYIIQPVPIWIQVVTRGFAPFSGNSQFIISTCLMIYALKLLNIFSIIMLLKLVFISIFSTIIMVSYIYMISSLAFYSPSVCEEISQLVLNLFVSTSYFPLGKFKFMYIILYSFVLPVGSIAWFPMKAIFNVNYCAIYILFAFIILIMSSVFFRKGLDYYAKKGACRYSGFGHR